MKTDQMSGPLYSAEPKVSGEGCAASRAPTAHSTGMPARKGAAMNVRGLAVVLVIGSILAVLMAKWIEVGELIVYQSQISEALPPVPAILALIILIALNPLLRRISPRLSLSRGQLLSIYIFCSISVFMAGAGMVRPFLPAITALQYFSASEPRDGMGQFLPFLKPLFFPRDPNISLGFYEGTDNGRIPWGAWLVPLAMWMAFFFALYLTMLCLFTLVRRQWVEKERLTFPLLALPLSLTESASGGGTSPFIRNPIMWVGLLAALLFNVTNAMHALDPSVPAMGTFFAISFEERPWSALNTGVSYRPSMFGLAYLIPTEVLFATFACYFLVKMEALGGMIVGQGNQNWPFVEHQSVGAYFALLVAMLWSGRQHLKQVLAKVLRGGKEVDDSGEALSYRTAFLGAILGFAFIVGYATALGMGWGVAILLMGIVVAFGLAYAKIRCEAGTPVVWSYPYDKIRQVLVYPVGTAIYSHKSLFGWSVFNFLTRGYWLSSFAFQIEGIKLAEESQITRKQMALIIMVATMVGLATAIWAHLAPSYEYGMNILQGGAGRPRGNDWVDHALTSYRELSNIVKTPLPADVPGSIATGIGFVTAIAMVWLRRSFFRVPMHPMGFILATTWGGELWASFFVAWLIKVVVTRIGGLRLHNTVRPAFLGIMFGHFLFSAAWASFGLLNPDWGGRYTIGFG